MASTVAGLYVGLLPLTVRRRDNFARQQPLPSWRPRLEQRRVIAQAP